MIPVSVVTGFLGAGKTTLLRRVLGDPAWANSAVIVNEFGEVPLDHELLAASEEVLVNVSTGCLCCVVRSDLTATLMELLRQRAAGTVPPYARVLIETSGLADPAPILHALMTDEAVAATHRLQSVVTLVDALHGAGTLARHPEAQRQAMLADRILLTKPDLGGDTAALEAALRAHNPAAPVRAAVQGAVEPAWLFAAGTLPEFLDASARHSEGVAGITLEREAPIPALALTLWMQALAEHAGARLLRLKGLVALAEDPGRPVVVHAIQHMVHPLEWLEAWPGADTRSRIVLIGQGIPRHLPARLLAAIEAEVRDAGG
ncbi:GTP-binding protein [Paeniroseomonas aquatica]|uniref:GTP-binding protein n=1 Tax=Paeniroseomonas aquatica TaxID=373043 RepID=A0ABT8AA15_9PROT|nr:GTP-binding protein [Paeniroseomonas aquatica]MDN3566545.1 GTP-binding protein [Paeniroseomonas aquatica]